MKTVNLTIGVPISTFAISSNSEIKKRLLTTLTDYDNYIICEDKKVNLVIRVTEDEAALVRREALDNKMTIVDFTASLLYKEE